MKSISCFRYVITSYFASLIFYSQMRWKGYCFDEVFYTKIVLLQKIGLIVTEHIAYFYEYCTKTQLTLRTLFMKYTLNPTNYG